MEKPISPSPTPEEQQALNLKLQYITQVNINAMVQARELKVRVTLGHTAGEILPDTAKYLRNEFLQMVSMLTPDEGVKQ